MTCASMKTRAMTLVAIGMATILTGACGSGALEPAPLDTRNEQCRACQMMVSGRRFASQIVARGEEPLFFDDLGCLATYLEKAPLAAGAVIFVADHRTSEWVTADRAVFSRVPTIDTPMGSHIVAHASEASRAQDTAAAGGTVLTADAALGPGRVAR